MLAKISQSYQANKTRTDSFPYKVGDWIWLDTEHRRCDFKDNTKGRTAKLMPRHDGPFQISAINPTASTVTVTWPSRSRLFPTFHIIHTKPFHPNDNISYPLRHQNTPTLPQTTRHLNEIDYIVEHKRCGRGNSYLVHYRNQPTSLRQWIPGRSITDISTLQDYWRNLTK